MFDSSHQAKFGCRAILLAIRSIGWAGAILVALALTAPNAVGDEDVQQPATIIPSRTVRVSVPTDGGPTNGTMTELGLDHFKITDTESAEHRFEWKQFKPAIIKKIYGRYQDPRSADDLYRLGVIINRVDEGNALAEGVIRRAKQMDAHVAKRFADIEQSQGESASSDEKEPEAGGESESGESESGEASEHGHGSEVVGAVEEQFWGKLTDEQMKSATEDLKKFAEQAETQLAIDMRGFETDYFIFVTDLDADEAEMWSKLLDKMYFKLCDLFGIERGVNIWRGKCVVFVFKEQNDYRRFEVEVMKVDPGGSAGLCHSFGDGTVKIAFYRQANTNDFAHVLVHESVHGFLHRFLKPARIPSWANEGLAEVIASELVPDGRQVEYKEAAAFRRLKDSPSLGPFFSHRQIESWQYGVASSMRRFMIQNGKKRYTEFIRGIKDGMDVDTALKEKYGTTRQRLIAAYGHSIGVANLRE